MNTNANDCGLTNLKDKRRNTKIKHRQVFREPSTATDHLKQKFEPSVISKNLICRAERDLYSDCKHSFHHSHLLRAQVPQLDPKNEKSLQSIDIEVCEQILPEKFEFIVPSCYAMADL